MKNITFSADEELIQRARQKAHAEHTTLNHAFRQWLTQYIGQGHVSGDYQALMESLSYAQAGVHFSREELNER